MPPFARQRVHALSKFVSKIKVLPGRRKSPEVANRAKVPTESGLVQFCEERKTVFQALRGSFGRALALPPK
jgi:hypothetical protein